MPLLGQASGGWTESSSALRILNVGIRNSVGVLTADSFTQTNPPVVSTNVSSRVDQTLTGVLSGSVTFTRPDAGANQIGGPGSGATLAAIQGALTQAVGFKAMGCFINSANGYPYENTPGTASGKGPYVSAQGTYGNGLYETAALVTSGNVNAGDALTYYVGVGLIASKNGYLMPEEQVAGGAVVDLKAFANADSNAAESFVRQAAAATVIGIVKMPPDASQAEVVYDQRI